MDFNWINIFGGIIVAVMLIPNIIYALTKKKAFSEDAPKALVISEQIGRYGCMILIWLPLLVWKFGFDSADGAVAYMVGNSLLLIIYIAAWLFFFQKRSRASVLTLCIAPSLIFMLSAVTLRHWLLLVFAILFAVCHIWISMKTFIPEEKITKKRKKAIWLVLAIISAVLAVVLPFSYFFFLFTFISEDIKLLLFFSQFFPIPFLTVFALLYDRAKKINRMIDNKESD